MNDKTDDSRKARDAAERVIAVCDVLAELTGIGQEAFVRDTRSQWAVEMGLIRIGEGINRIPAAVLEQYDGQPWRLIVGMRNFAAHQYDDLDPRRVWRTATQDVPALRGYLTDVVLPGLPGQDG
ncbi:HepT-like ribonuclease domain-containing protein [Propionibacteriaceae bacterium Y2011]